MEQMQPEFLTESVFTQITVFFGDTPTIRSQKV